MELRILTTCVFHSSFGSNSTPKYLRVKWMNLLETNREVQQCAPCLMELEHSLPIPSPVRKMPQIKYWILTLSWPVIELVSESVIDYIS